MTTTTTTTKDETMKTTTPPATCPHCRRENKAAHAEGAAEGPREYHADCWDLAAASMTEDERQAAFDDSAIGN